MSRQIIHATFARELATDTKVDSKSAEVIYDIMGGIFRSAAHGMATDFTYKINDSLTVIEIGNVRSILDSLMYHSVYLPDEDSIKIFW